MPSHWNDKDERESRSAVRRAFAREVRRISAIQNPFIAVVAIVTLGGMEIVALQRGIDGALFGIVVAAIAGIAGYTVHGLKRFGKNE